MKISQVEIKTTTTGKPYKTCMVDNTKASVWADNSGFYASIVDGAEVEGILTQNEKGYWNLKGKLEPPSFLRNRPNPGLETQKVITENVKVAQDRNELMWAKYGACEIIAHHPAYKGTEVTHIPAEIVHLTKLIIEGSEQPF